MLKEGEKKIIKKKKVHDSLREQKQMQLWKDFVYRVTRG